MYKVYYGEYEFEMIAGAYMQYNDTLEITIYGEGISLDYVENIVKNIDNLKEIKIYDDRPQLVAKFNKYTAFDKLEKNPHYLLRKYDDEGNLNETYGEVIIITTKVPEMRDELMQVKSDMEYIAIMTDVDLGDK